MSQIFDALQRSEAERHGRDSAAAAHAIELLQFSERKPNSGGNGKESQAKFSTTVLTDAQAEVAEPSDSSNALVSDLLIENAVQPADYLAEGPMQCEVISMSVPPESRLVALPENHSPTSEAFHLLGVRLRHMRRQRNLKKLLITSTIPQEGKSMVAANLACTLGLRTQQKVLLLEGDVRRPTQSKIFGISSKSGLCEYLSGETSLVQSMYRLELPGIWILPAGTATANSLELLQSGRLSKMIEKISGWFDWIVIDSPPILPLADTSVWSNLADGGLIVTRRGITQKRQLKRGLEALGSQKLIGAVMNSARNAANTDYYYYSPQLKPTKDQAQS